MKKLPYISIILLPTLLGGCLSDRESCPDQGTGPTKESRLNLTLTVGYPSTRAAEHDKLENGTPEENYIDIENDLKTYILVKSPATDGGEEDWKIYEEFEADIIVPGNGTYLLSGKLPDELRSRDIRLLALANWGSMGGSDKYPVITDGSEILLSDLYLNGTDYNYNYPTGTSLTWTPAASSGKGIPMAGITEPQRIPAPDNLFVLEMDMGQLPMLRSLAKIEIVDMTEEDNKVSLEGVTLTRAGATGTSYNTIGRLIPDGRDDKNPEWYKENQQVTEPSLPENVEVSASELSFHSLNENKTHFVAYVPEMDLRGDNPPVMNVTLKVDGVRKSYTVKFAKYDGKTAGEAYQHLLRNHIYRFNITKVETGIDADLTLLIETPEWDVDDDQNWDYEDLKPGWKEDGGKFFWENPNYDKSDLDDQQRILLVTPSEGAVGTFTLESPKNTQWILSLVTDDGTPNHWFRIDLWDETIEDWIVQDQMPDADKFIADTQSGMIDGKQVKFRIMATNVNESEQDYSARVVLTLQTFDGRVLNVDLNDNDSETDPGEDKYYYKVKQLTNGGSNM